MKTPNCCRLSLQEIESKTNNTFIFANSSDTKKVIKNSGGQDFPWKAFDLRRNRELLTHPLCPFSTPLGVVPGSCVSMCTRASPSSNLQLTLNKVILHTSLIFQLIDSIFKATNRGYL